MSAFGLSDLILQPHCLAEANRLYETLLPTEAVPRTQR